MIVKRGTQHCVTDATGQTTIACHPTEQAALDQLAAIEAEKARKAGKYSAPFTIGYRGTEAAPGAAIVPLATYFDKAAWRHDEAEGFARKCDFQGTKVTRETDDLLIIARGALPALADNQAVTEVFTEVAGFKEFRAASLKSIKDVELFRVGTWNGDKYTSQHLNDIVQAASAGLYRIPIKLGHSRDDNAPAHGWLENVRRVGDKIVGDFVDLPPDVYDLIKSRRYDQVSIELAFNMKRDGVTYPTALTGVAILGASIPAVAGLRPLHQSVFESAASRRAVFSSTEDTMDPKLLKALGLKPDATEAEVDAAIAKRDAEATFNVNMAKMSPKHIAFMFASVDESKRGEFVTMSAKQRDKLIADAGDEDEDGDALTFKELQEQNELLRKNLKASQDSTRQARVDRAIESLRLPAFREHFAALYTLAFSDEADRTVKFTATDEETKKSKTSDVPLTRVLDDMIKRLNAASEKLFSSVSTRDAAKDTAFTRDDTDDGDGEIDSPTSAGEELDRKARAFMAEKSEKSYQKAFAAVLADPKNKELKALYAQR